MKSDGRVVLHLGISGRCRPERRATIIVFRIDSIKEN